MQYHCVGTEYDQRSIYSITSDVRIGMTAFKQLECTPLVQLTVPDQIKMEDQNPCGCFTPGAAGR